MKITELRQKSSGELKDFLLGKRVRLAELRFLLQQKKIKNFREISVVKKDIARILTLFKEPNKL